MKKKYDLKNAKTAQNKGIELLNRDYFFNSAVLIPIVKIKDDFHILFEVRSVHVRQPGEVCFPGGKIDEIDKSFKHAAIRETMEELSLKRNQIKFIGNFGSFVNVTGVYIEAFVGELKISSLDEIEFEKKEVASVFTIPINYFINNKPDEYSFGVSIKPSKKDHLGKETTTFPVKKLKLPNKYRKSRELKGYPVYVYETEYGVIWGITAYLLKKFIERISKN